jgi:hypothetical protein
MSAGGKGNGGKGKRKPRGRKSKGGFLSSLTLDWAPTYNFLKNKP